MKQSFRHPRNKSLAFWGAFLLVVGGLVLAGGVWFYRSQEQEVRRSVEANLETIAHLKVNQIVQWRGERRADVGMLMGSIFFNETVARWLADPQAGSSDKILASFRAMQRYNHYHDILLADRRGQIRLSISDHPSPFHGETTQALAEVFRTRQAVLTDLHVPPDDPVPHLEIIAPVFVGNEPTTEPIGAIILQFEARQFLYPLIQSWPSASSTAETELVRLDGDAVMFLNDLRHRGGTAFKLRILLSRLEVPAVQAALGKAGMFHGTDYRGVKVLSVLKQVPDSSWAMVAKIDEEEALAEWHSRASLIVAVILTLAAALGTAAAMAWQQQIRYRVLAQSATALRDSEDMLNETGHIARIGGWAIDLMNGTLKWTREVYAIHEVEDGFLPTVEAAINFYAPESRPIIQQAVDLAIQAGEPFDIELELITAKNRRIWVQAIGHAVFVSGKAQTVSGTFQDITEHKRAEKALRESETKFRTLVENIPQKIFVKDRNSRWLAVNENFAHDLGLRSEELVGKVDYDFFPKELADKYRADDERVMRTGQTEELEEKYLREGLETWVHVVKAPVRDEHGEIAGVFGIFWDITERKRAEEEIHKLNSQLERRVYDRTTELAAANKELEAFSYSVSHDLRTPLRAIDGFSHALQEDYGNRLDEAGRDHLQRVRAAAQRMGRLIDDLLQLSRLGKAALHKERVNLSTLAQDIIAELRTGDPQRQVEVVISENLCGEADLRLLHVVMENLLRNAWKFTCKTPMARIEFGQVSGGSHSATTSATPSPPNGLNEAMRSDGTAVFFVRDNGAGFDMKNAEKLFGAFQRLHAATEFPGTGIGLATVARIIHRHAGAVWAEAAEGQGATFYFTLEPHARHAANMAPPS